MTGYAARALQVLDLEEDQIKRLHFLEEKCHYVIPNWNIQQIFGLRPIKFAFKVIEDPEKAATFAESVEAEIKAQGWLKPGDTPFDVRWYHSFDWLVFKNKNRLSGSISGSKTGSLMSRLASSGNR